MKLLTMFTKAAPVVALAAAVGLLAGCGGGSSSSGSQSSNSSSSVSAPAPSAPASPTTVQVPAGAVQVGLSEYKFTPSAMHAKAGDVKFYLTNNGTVDHDLGIELPSGIRVSPKLTPGQSLLWDAGVLKAGTYKVECTVPGHASMGMVGTLIVS